MKNALVTTTAVLFMVLGVFGQGNDSIAPASASSTDDYWTVKGIIKECGLENVPMEKVAVLSGNMVVSLDLSNRDVSKDGIVIIPHSVGNLSELQRLVATDNIIKSIPSSLFKLNKLRTLNLASNRIVTVPEEIGKLENLDSLDLRHNRLESLPSSIGDLKKLSYLHLWGNKLASLPSRITSLPNLKELYLKDNSIVSLPEKIMDMKSLVYIDFQNNKICKVSPRMETWLRKKDKQYSAQQRCWK
ncbi:MAG: leucine-rich repeat domain-containing protein [Chitinispirillaceae bacterium]|nr:leucine-rich repeat domain-containing protein [Chitinispirillaceae bacterium]